jgi:hypothetical protein
MKTRRIGRELSSSDSGPEQVPADAVVFIPMSVPVAEKIIVGGGIFDRFSICRIKPAWIDQA